MSDFFESNPDVLEGGSGKYVNEAGKKFLRENGVPITIVGVKVEADPFEKDRERYVITALIPNAETGDDEEKLLAHPAGTVESRDRMLDTMAKWLEDPSNTPPVVKMDKVGRSLVYRPFNSSDES